MKSRFKIWRKNLKSLTKTRKQLMGIKQKLRMGGMLKNEIIFVLNVLILELYKLRMAFLIATKLKFDVLLFVYY